MSAGPEPPRNDRANTAPADTDALITHIAASQHGVVLREQLVAAGISVDSIEYRLEQGRLRRLYRGVYRTGAVVSVHEAAMAAILACGTGAMLSHFSAGAQWKLPRRSTSAGPIDIGVRAGRRAPGPGVCVHRLGTLFDDEATQSDGLPITTPARTLLDLAPMLDARALERDVAYAEREGLVDRSGRDVARATPGPARCASASYARERGRAGVHPIRGGSPLPLTGATRTASSARDQCHPARS